MLHDDVNCLYFLFLSPILKLEIINALFQSLNADPEKMDRELDVHHGALKSRVAKKQGQRLSIAMIDWCKFRQWACSLLQEWWINHRWSGWFVSVSTKYKAALPGFFHMPCCRKWRTAFLTTSSSFKASVPFTCQKWCHKWYAFYFSIFLSATSWKESKTFWHNTEKSWCTSGQKNRCLMAKLQMTAHYSGLEYSSMKTYWETDHTELAMYALACLSCPLRATAKEGPQVNISFQSFIKPCHCSPHNRPWQTLRS